MTTFALVHGAWGSGWHWASIPDRLRAAGHEVVAPDLPCDDPRRTLDDYAQVVLDALGDAGDVVVVGFSLGGVTATLVAARSRARRLVYIAGVVPLPGLSLADQMRRGDVLFRPEYLPGVEVLEGGAGSRWVDADLYHRVGYDDWITREVVRERFDRLRPQANAPFLERLPLEAPPDVPTAYVVCARDRLMNNELWPERVAVTHELDCAHTAIVARPDEVTDILLEGL